MTGQYKHQGGVIQAAAWPREEVFPSGRGSSGSFPDPVGDLEAQRGNRQNAAKLFEPGPAKGRFPLEGKTSRLQQLRPQAKPAKGDGVPDGWEVANNLNATNPTGIDGMMGDPDADGDTEGNGKGEALPPSALFGE